MLVLLVHRSAPPPRGELLRTRSTFEGKRRLLLECLERWLKLGRCTQGKIVEARGECAQSGDDRLRPAASV
jgi:hypothetical protein